MVSFYLSSLQNSKRDPSLSSTKSNPLVSGMQQSDSVLYVYYHTLILFICMISYIVMLSSIVVYYRTLNKVPRAIEQDLVVYLFFMW